MDLEEEVVDIIKILNLRGDKLLLKGETSRLKSNNRG
jgi:hypothetical protein